MRIIKTFLLCILMLSASGAIADYIRTDHDRSAPFYQYRTFMWAKEPQLPNGWVNEWIIRAVNEELEAKGLCLVRENADLAVSATTATCSEVPTFYALLTGGWSWYHYWTPVEPATTVVEAFNADTL